MTRSHQTLPDRLGGMTAEEIPAWFIPPPEGFTAEDLDRLPGLPRRAELIDGSLVLMSPQTKWHSRVVHYLRQALSDQASEHWNADSEMSVRLGTRDRPEPDVLLVSATSYQRPEPSTFYLPEDVLLVVEVVSADSEARDRERKPQLYARAGIRHFWRMERQDEGTVAYAYELDPATHSYGLAGIFHDRIKLTAPFPIEIDLKALDS